MRKLFGILFLAIAVACQAASQPSGNARYLKDGTLNSEYLGELVVLKGIVSAVGNPLRMPRLVQMTLPAPAVGPVWVGSLFPPTGNEDFFGMGHDIVVMGYLELETDAETIQTTGREKYVMGSCFFNFTTKTELSSDPDFCDQFQAYNRSFVGQGLDELIALAAEEDPAALNALGSRYQNGNGVEKDLGQAVDYYLRASELGNTTAMSNLAAMYQLGLGVTKDADKAFQLYMQAAELLDPSAMTNLGVFYVTGRKEAPALVTAYMWLLLGNHYSKQVNDQRVELASGRGIEMLNNQMTKTQIAEAKALARDWIKSQ